MSALTLGSRIKLLCIFLITVMILVGCGGEGDSEGSDLDEDDVLEIALDLNKIMNTEDDYILMGDAFDDYRDIISEYTYNKYFDVSSRLVASLYINEGVEKSNYNVLESIVTSKEDSSGEELVVVYILYEVEWLDNEDIGEEGLGHGLEGLQVKGANKYIFRDGILSGFERII